MSSYSRAIKALGWEEYTQWFLLINGIHFNHIEKGHAKGDKPKGHKSWSKQKWSKLYVYAESGSKPLRFI